MADRQLPEDERVRRLLAAAAEPEGPVAPPGAAFTARARRGLLRRRLAVAGAVAVAVAAVAVAVPTVLGGGGEARPASGACVQDTLETMEKRRAEGYRPVYGTLREGRVDLDDGVTRSSGFRFDIEGALADGEGVPDSGRVTVWYPAAEVQLPDPGRHVLLLERSERPAKGDGEPLYSFAPELAPPLTDDDRATLRCGGTTELDRLRTDEVP